MKIFVNKEIRKLFLALSVIWMAASADPGILISVLPEDFFVPVTCFCIGRRIDTVSVLFLFPETGSAYGTGSVTDQRVS